MQISIFDKEYPKPRMDPEKIAQAISETPTIVRMTNGDIDVKATLANSPITKLYAEAESKALQDAQHSINDNALAHLDAFERRMLSLGIKGSTDIATAMSVFYRPDNRGMFPELIERAVLISENTLVGDQVAESDLVGSVINIPSITTKATKLALADASGS